MTKKQNVSALHFRDDVYGDHDVSEPILLYLLASRAINRLRFVSQAGATSLVRPGRSVTRYEHSVGVMILTKILGGSVLEQAAGLLQDASHTAFSHTIDYVFKNRSEEFHESIFKSVIADSDVPGILSKHGVDWESLFESSNIKLVDAPAPLLCADRIDYTLRDLVRFGYVKSSDARYFITSLFVNNGVIVCADENLAERFVLWYVYLVENLFMNPLELYIHDEFASIIRDAMQIGLVTNLDIIGVDSDIIDKLMIYPSTRDRVNLLLSTRDVIADETHNGHRIYSKARTIDPLILIKREIVPLSQLKPNMASLWTNILRIGTEGLVVRRVL